MYVVDYNWLRDMYRGAGPRQTVEAVSRLLAMGRQGEPGGIQPEEFTSLRRLAEAVIPNGREWVDSLNPHSGGVMALEDAVDSTAFSNITGQIVYSLILERYQRPEYVFSQLVSNRPTRFKDGERIPGTTGILGENMDVIHEGKEYPYAGMGEDWIQTPALEKRGTIVAVTAETIFADNIGRIQDDARNVGDLLAYNKEVRLVDHAIGAVNTYSRKGVPYNTYQETTPWINDHVNPLEDWESIDASRLLWSDMRDPNTGKEILVNGDTIIVTPHRMMTARRILNATEIRVGDTTDPTGTQTISANPVAGMFNLRESQIMYSRIQNALNVSAEDAKEYWLHMDVGRFLVYMEGWPLRVVQAPPQSPAEFNRDVVLQFKASEFGVPAILDPRYSIRNKAS